MTIRPFVLIVLASGLSFCASEPVPVNYYLLAGETPEGISVQTAGDKPSLVLESVDVANFLQQTGIVMQTAGTQVQVSKRHLWAETLDEALPKLLFRELQKQSSDFNFYLKYADFVARTDYRLIVQIESFQATSEGEVICSGRYQIISQTNADRAVTVDFNFKRNLERDGYEHAIEQLRLLVQDVAKNAIASATTLATN